MYGVVAAVINAEHMQRRACDHAPMTMMQTARAFFSTTRMATHGRAVIRGTAPEAARGC